MPAWTLWHRTSGDDWYAAGMYTLAEAKLALGYDPKSGQEIEFPDGTRRELTIRSIAASVPAWHIRERIKDEMFAAAWRGALAGFGIIALFLVWFWFRGARLGRLRRIRGAELVSARELARQVQPPRARLLESMPGAGRLRSCPRRRHPLSAAHRDPAHHRLGHHRLGQDRADRGPGGPGPRPRRALRHLRQDGELHPVVLPIRPATC